MSKNKGFFKITRKNFKSKEFKNLLSSSKILYMELCYISSKFGYDWFFHSIRQLAKECNLSNKSIVIAKKQLMKNGLIFIEKREKECDYFKIVYDYGSVNNT